MLPRIHSTKLPEILWIQVFKYITIKDFVNLKAVCKRLKEYTDRYPEIYQRECIRLYSSDSFFFYYSIEPDTSFTEISSNPFKWQRLLQKLTLIRSDWACLCVPNELNCGFNKLGDYIFSVLKGNLLFNHRPTTCTS